MPELGVNIDHVATVREARKTNEPDPVWAAALAEMGGADGITIHLREDRRHIQERDVRLLKQTVRAKLNLEIACEDSVLKIAEELKPEQATLVPEKREEVTTEGGLDIVADERRVRAAIDRLKNCGVSVSLFLDPDADQLAAAAEFGADAVELHTGQYALATTPAERDLQLGKLIEASAQIRAAKMILHAGHGLTYHNVIPVAAIDDMHELNIGHSIVSRAMMVGMKEAVREMKNLITRNPHSP